MHAVLSTACAATYASDGYCLPEQPVLPAARFAALKARFEEILPVWTGHYGQRAEAFDKPHFLFPDLFSWLLDPCLLDLVEPLIGPDIALFSSHFICKPARSGQRVPWHEDSSYWRGIFDQIDDVCTLWLALDRSDRENGCLRVVAGSHVGGYSGYRPVADPSAAVFGSEISDPIDASRIVDFELEPNHCSIHHARMIHGSEPNRSARRRCGLSIRYVSTRCRYLGGPMPRSFGLYLCRGVDRGGNRYLDPGVINTAWAEELFAGRLPPDGG